jgi:hypothetical protein
MSDERQTGRDLSNSPRRRRSRQPQVSRRPRSKSADLYDSLDNHRDKRGTHGSRIDSYRPDDRQDRVRHRYRSRSRDDSTDSDQGYGGYQYYDLDEPSPHRQKSDRVKFSDRYRPLSEGTDSNDTYDNHGRGLPYHSNYSRTVRDIYRDCDEFGRDLRRSRSPPRSPFRPVCKPKSKVERPVAQVSLESGSVIQFVEANKATIQKKPKEAEQSSDIRPGASVLVRSNNAVQPVDVHDISSDSVMPIVDTRVSERNQLRAERNQLRIERDQLRTERDQLRTERDQLRTERDQHRSGSEQLRAVCDQLRAECDVENQQLTEAHEKMRMESVGKRESTKPSSAEDVDLKLLLASQKRRRELLNASRLSSRQSPKAE